MAPPSPGTPPFEVFTNHGNRYCTSYDSYIRVPQYDTPYACLDACRADGAADGYDRGASGSQWTGTTEGKIETEATCTESGNAGYWNVKTLRINDASGTPLTYNADCSSTPPNELTCENAFDGTSNIYSPDWANNEPTPFFIQWTTTGANPPAEIELEFGSWSCSPTFTLHRRETPGSGAWTQQTLCGESSWACDTGSLTTHSL